MLGIKYDKIMIIIFIFIIMEQEKITNMFLKKAGNEFSFNNTDCEPTIVEEAVLQAAKTMCTEPKAYFGSPNDFVSSSSDSLSVDSA